MASPEPSRSLLLKRPLERVRRGARLVLRAARLVATQTRLRRASLWPTVLTALGCLGVAGVAALERDAEDGTALHVFVGTFLAVSSLPPTVLQRMWQRVGLEARLAAGTTPGQLERPDEGYLAMLWRESWKAVRQTVAVGVGLGPLLLVVTFLPYDTALLGVLTAAWGGYWTIVDAFEIPMELVPGKQGELPPSWFERGFARLAKWRVPFFGLGARFLGWVARPWRHEVRFTERHPWETLGFGLAAGTLLLMPGLGLFFRAVAITGATALIADLNESEREDQADGAGP